MNTPRQTPTEENMREFSFTNEARDRLWNRVLCLASRHEDFRFNLMALGLIPVSGNASSPHPGDCR